MKSLLVILITIVTFSSCCKKGPYPIATVTLKYTSLSAAHDLFAIRTNRNEITSVIDTVKIGVLNSTNFYTAVIELEEGSPDLIFIIKNTSYADTLTEINFEHEGGCNDKIINFSYKYNNKLKTDTEISISN